MRNLLNPKWLFIINTLPIIVLFFILSGEFQIIKTQLDENGMNLWKCFSLALIFLGISNFLYAAYLSIKKQKVSAYFGFIALLCYTPFLYLYGYYISDLFPFSIPRWMISENAFLYVGTFVMPTLAYSLFILVAHFTFDAKDNKAWKSFLMALLVPISWYLFSQILFPLSKVFGDGFEMHGILIFLIVGTLIFLFFMIRTIFILTSKRANSWKKYQLAWKIPISIIFPLMGLALNNGHLFKRFALSGAGIFGDFGNYWFYVLAIINGILICLPNIENKNYRLLLFIGRSITFAYTFYFFLVFLPFLPLSVIAIVAIGTGFLMLTPLLLFVLHLKELSNDFRYLKLKVSKRLLWGLCLTGFLVIPICLTLSNLFHRHTLNQALEYIYTPDYSKKYKVNEISLQKTLKVIKGHKLRNNMDIFGIKLPYLSSYFNWIVLDNLSLSYSKINTIERIFFDKKSIKNRSENIQNDKVKITDIKTSSIYDQSQNAWKSWIDLEITNANDNRRFSEYSTTIDLPVGTYISDYYLYVGDKKEMGILSEKKTAMWVFSSIRNTNRDPGILYYLTGNKVAFRVFPFANNEVRKTGIELLHKEPIELTIDGNLLSLGNSEIKSVTGHENESIRYVSALEKQNLQEVKRKPYFHFLVDATNDNSLNNYNDRINKLTKKYKHLAENGRVSFVNSYVYSSVLKEDWQQSIKNIKCQGGFYLDRAIKSVLYNSYLEHSYTYPVIVVVTDNLDEAIFNKDFSDWGFSFPETHLFYNLNDQGDLDEHSLISNPAKKLKTTEELSLDHSVLEYKLKDDSARYIPDNQKPSLIVKIDLLKTKESEIIEKNWGTALKMHGMWKSQILHPKSSNEEWLSLVRSSFRSKIMTPVTSYLVVENEAQKAILKKKQEQVLKSNKSLDLGEEVQSMSEPGLFVMLFFMGLLLYGSQKEKMFLWNC